MRYFFISLGLLVAAVALAEEFNPHFHDFETYPWKRFAPREMDFLNLVVSCNSAPDAGAGIRFDDRSGLELKATYAPGQTTNIGVGLDFRPHLTAYVVVIRDEKTKRLAYAYPHDKMTSSSVGTTTVWKIPATQAEGAYEFVACLFTDKNEVIKTTKAFRIAK